MYPCPKCGDFFARKYCLERHLHHKKKPCDLSKIVVDKIKVRQKKPICELCNKKYSSLEALKFHQDNFMCDNPVPTCIPCCIVFPTRRNLLLHEKVEHHNV